MRVVDMQAVGQALMHIIGGEADAHRACWKLRQLAMGVDSDHKNALLLHSAPIMPSHAQIYSVWPGVGRCYCSVISRLPPLTESHVSRLQCTHRLSSWAPEGLQAGCSSDTNSRASFLKKSHYQISTVALSELSSFVLKCTQADRPREDRRHGANCKRCGRRAEAGLPKQPGLSGG